MINWSEQYFQKFNKSFFFPIKQQRTTKPIISESSNRGERYRFAEEGRNQFYLKIEDGYEQGCQIVLGATYQNWETYTKNTTKYSSIGDLNQMAITYTKLPYVQMPKFSIASRSEIYEYWDFWYENIPSGNPGYETRYLFTQFRDKILLW
jgi:hypothetical protein